MTTSHRSCHHCGRALGAGGRRNTTGRTYCSEAACKRARARYLYEQRMQTDRTPDAPPYCFNPACARKLTPRKVRIGDSPVGRWCNAPACRQHKKATLAYGPLQEKMVIAENAERSMEFWHRAGVFGWIVCECGQERCVEGYPHFSPKGDRCALLGDYRSLWIEDAKALYGELMGANGGLPATLVGKID